MSVAVGPTSFSCPHCAVVYPFKAALVGKSIRCKSCSGVFRLRPEGVAERILEPGQNQPLNLPPVTPAAITAPLPPATPAPATEKKSRSGRLQVTSEQDNLRRQMAASLAESMGKALEADAVKAEEKKAKTESQKAGPGAGGKDDKKKRSGKVILTGEGERAAENDRRWLFGGIAAVLVLAGLIWAVNHENARQRALEAFVSEVPAAQNLYGKRAQAIQERAWVIAPPLNRPGVEPVIGFDEDKLGPIITIPSASLSTLARLKGQKFFRDLGLWADPAHLAKIKAKTAAGIPASVILKELQAAGVDEPGLGVLDTLLHGEPSPATKDLLARLVNDTPPTVRICPVTGTNASILIDIGGGYRIRSGDFTATLVSLDGPGWPGEWRVSDFTLAPAAR